MEAFERRRSARLRHTSQHQPVHTSEPKAAVATIACQVQPDVPAQKISAPDSPFWDMLSDFQSRMERGGSPSNAHNHKLRNLRPPCPLLFESLSAAPQGSAHQKQLHSDEGSVLLPPVSRKPRIARHQQRQQALEQPPSQRQASQQLQSPQLCHRDQRSSLHDLFHLADKGIKLSKSLSEADCESSVPAVHSDCKGVHDVRQQQDQLHLPGQRASPCKGGLLSELLQPASARPTKAPSGRRRTPFLMRNVVQSKRQLPCSRTQQPSFPNGCKRQRTSEHAAASPEKLQPIAESLTAGIRPEQLIPTTVFEARESAHPGMRVWKADTRLAVSSRHAASSALR